MLSELPPPPADRRLIPAAIASRILGDLVEDAAFRDLDGRAGAWG